MLMGKNKVRRAGIKLVVGTAVRRRVANFVMPAG